MIAVAVNDLCDICLAVWLDRRVDCRQQEKRANNLGDGRQWTEDNDIVDKWSAGQ